MLFPHYVNKGTMERMYVADNMECPQIRGSSCEYCFKLQPISSHLSTQLFLLHIEPEVNILQAPKKKDFEPPRPSGGCTNFFVRNEEWVRPLYLIINHEKKCMEAYA